MTWWQGILVGVVVGFSVGLAVAFVCLWRLVRVEEHPGEQALRDFHEWLDGLPETSER